MSAAIVWFRSDLRLRDNAALTAACRGAERLVPVYILDPDSESPWPRGAASRWWLHHSLDSLDRQLAAKGSRLILLRGDSASVLAKLARSTGAERIHVTRRYEPHLADHDVRCEEWLASRGIELVQHGGGLLCEPESLRKADGQPYRRFTPFWNALQRRLDAGEPEAEPEALPPLPEGVAGLPLAQLGLLPETDWHLGIAEAWRAGEAAAQKRLQTFADSSLADYADARDRLESGGTALSPHLAFGEITPRTIACRLREAASGEAALRTAATALLRQLAWREFAAYTLHHNPDSVSRPLDRRFEHFPWREDEPAFAAWCRGESGIPLVDAGMRQLWQSGFLHNRARMVVASFLTKNLLIPWQKGAHWFWETLVDADLANNTLGWQWVAGCGVDAAPYFRIFNPVRQGERFDPEGNYVRRWIPELRNLETRWIHHPWEAPARKLNEAGIVLGRTYPRPIVDLAGSRHRALEAYEKLKERRNGR
ncbi:MAG: deoxyribodipyrimidine photo-lyase [Gammaproteobacteria bacterium]